MCYRIKPVLFLFLLAITGLQAQSDQDKLDLQHDLEVYKQVSMQMDIDSLLTFMPPRMLTLVPKEQLKTQLAQAFDNEELYMVFDTMTIGAFSDIKKANEYLCTLVPYSGKMEMHFKEAKDSLFLELMIPMLEGQFAEGAIQIQNGTEDELFLSIDLQQKNMIAFKKEGFSSWKFIEDKRGPGVDPNDQQMMMIKMFVPAVVLDATQ